MLNKVAGKLAKRLAEYSDIDKEELYIYGLEIIISTSCCLLSIIMISCLLSSFTSGLVFISVFVPLRLFTGGYHATTYSKCFVISNLVNIVYQIHNMEQISNGDMGMFVDRHVLLYYKKCTNYSFCTAN